VRIAIIVVASVVRDDPSLCVVVACLLDRYLSAQLRCSLKFAQMTSVCCTAALLVLPVCPSGCPSVLHWLLYWKIKIPKKIHNCRERFLWQE